MGERHRRNTRNSRLRWLSLAGLSAGIAFSQTISQYVESTDQAASISVRVDHPASFHIPRTIYGTFLEHIGQSVFGGVSAELLDNPSLEIYPANPQIISSEFSAHIFQESTRLNVPLPWIPLRLDGRRYEPRFGGAVNSNAYLYVMGLQGREVGIRQSIYVPTERQLDYEGVLFALASEGSVKLSVSFRQHNQPDTILAFSELEVPNQCKWTKLTFQLKLPADALSPLEAVDFAVAVKDGGRVSLDEIRLYPTDASDGLDPQVVELAKDIHTPLLRYGGNFSSGYHWRDGVGPLDQRPTRLNEAWGTPEYNEFGTDELMSFCKRIGALPQICLNLGSGSPREAQGWVEYCQGSPSTVQGRRRTDNGHRLPYRVGAWELGNELYDDTQLGWYKPEGFAERYLQFFHALDSSVGSGTPVLANGGEIDSFKKWNGALLSRAGPELQFITTHLVADMEHTRNRNAERDQVIAADLGLPVGVGRQLDGLREQIDSYPATRGRVKVSYSEWMFRSPATSSLPNYDNMGGAVIAAAWLNMLAQHSDFIPMANMTGLVEFAGIHKRRGRTFVTPQYWTLYLYSKYAGDLAVESLTRAASYDVHQGQVFAPEIPAVSFLDVLATLQSDTGNLSVFVVNRNWKSSVPGEIHLSGMPAKKEIKVFTLSAGSLLARNDEEHQDAVRPVESDAQMNSGTIQQVFPPGSLTVLLVSPAPKG